MTANPRPAMAGDLLFWDAFEKRRFVIPITASARGAWQLSRDSPKSGLLYVWEHFNGYCFKITGGPGRHVP